MVRIFMEGTWFWMREGFLGFTERVFKAFPLISGFQIPGSDARTPREACGSEGVSACFRGVWNLTLKDFRAQDPFVSSVHAG